MNEKDKYNRDKYNYEKGFKEGYIKGINEFLYNHKEIIERIINPAPISIKVTQSELDIILSDLKKEELKWKKQF